MNCSSHRLLKGNSPAAITARGSQPFWLNLTEKSREAAPARKAGMRGKDVCESMEL